MAEKDVGGMNAVEKPALPSEHAPNWPQSVSQSLGQKENALHKCLVFKQLQRAFSIPAERTRFELVVTVNRYADLANRSTDDVTSKPVKKLRLARKPSYRVAYSRSRKLSPELARLVAVWDALPLHIRQVITTLAESASIVQTPFKPSTATS